MDAAKKKALFRAKVNAQKKDKRIDSALVWYNESDQPICRVCNFGLKSESQWDAHQVSRKHHEALKNFKANAAGHVQLQNSKPVPSTEPPKPIQAQLRDIKVETSKLPKPPSSSVLPPDFFDNRETKRQKIDSDSVKSLGSDKKLGSFVQTKVMSSLENEPDGFLGVNDMKTESTQHTVVSANASIETISSETKQVNVKGALPEGFFDNKEADLRARGIKLVKPDVKDEYKEFEKLIQEDLLEVDDRLEEEEIDAAEIIEGAETLEQKAYREKVELLKQRKIKLMAARSAAKSGRGCGVTGKESSHEESSSDEDADENFAVDWRAQHL